MIMCIQNLVSICRFVLKIWSKNRISDVNQGTFLCCKFAKTMICNSKVDIVNDTVYTKFGLNRSNRFQEIEQKLNSDVNEGP